MLFVSQQEPLTSKNLIPDTSLHNERHSYETSCQSSCSSSPCTPECESDCNTCSPSKLTKDQLALHREFLRLGSLLLADNVSLFHNALTLLSAKHGLKIATPATCVSDILPAPKRRNRSADDSSSGKTGSRKYALPKDIAEKEFYQCMVCKERRTINSFVTTHHTHEANERPCIRWYCPLCDTFFAVTHRVYHIKCRHSDLLTVHPAFSESTATKRSVAWKRTRNGEEDESDVVSYAPLEKAQHTECPLSPASVESMTSNSSPSIETMDYSSSESSVSPLGTVFYQFDTEEIPLFSQNEEQSELFPLEN